MCSSTNLYVENGLGGQGNKLDLICSGRNLYIEKKLGIPVEIVHKKMKYTRYVDRADIACSLDT